MKFQYLFLIITVLLSGCGTFSHKSKVLGFPKKKESHFISVEKGQLEYYQLGSGSPIVLITGYGMDISSWNRKFLLALSKQHRVVVFNNRNIGRSFIRSLKYDTVSLARDTHQLISKLHLKKPAVLGISMGGMIAQQFAVLYPKQVSHLILINTAIAGKKAIHPSIATERKVWAMPASKFGQYFFALNLFFPTDEKWRMAVVLVKDRFSPKDYVSLDVSGVLPFQRLLVLRWLHNEAVAERLAKLTLPVLVLNGASDAVIPPINSNILVQVIPHAKLQQWRDGGHAMIYQYPEELAQVINRFMQLNG